VTVQQPPRPLPILGRTAVVETVSGVVLVRPAGTKRFVALTTVRSIAARSEIDARRGRVRLTVARRAGGGGAVDVADAYLGRFRFTQSRGLRPLTTLKLTGGNFTGCGSANPKVRVKIATAARRKKRSHRVVRRLWVDAQGAFRTAGRYAAATVRGTRWQTIDRCDSVEVRVASGVVSVRDILRGSRARNVRAGRRRSVPGPRN
jgi:hypothetical protein